MSTELQRYSLNGETMGSRYTALFYAEPDLSTEAIHHSLARAVSRVDQQMSTWKAELRPQSPQCRAPNSNGSPSPRS